MSISDPNSININLLNGICQGWVETEDCFCIAGDDVRIKEIAQFLKDNELKYQTFVIGSGLPKKLEGKIKEIDSGTKYVITIDKITHFIQKDIDETLLQAQKMVKKNIFELAKDEKDPNLFSLIINHKEVMKVTEEELTEFNKLVDEFRSDKSKLSKTDPTKPKLTDN